MPRIDIRDLDKETIEQLDEQCKKYGINSRADYIRMLIKLDILTDIVKIINKMKTWNSANTISKVYYLIYLLFKLILGEYVWL